MIVTRFVSVAKPESVADTSFATMKSIFFDSIFFRAFARRFSVYAANATFTNRPAACSRDTEAMMSVVFSSEMLASLLLSSVFLIF